MSEDRTQSGGGTQPWQEYTTDPVDTWWYDGDCPECGHVVSSNGTVRVCGERDDQCDWWELIDDE